MQLDETNKYMGTAEGEGTDNSQIKDKLVKEYYHWVWQNLKTAKIEEQDHSYQHLSCTIPTLQLQNSQLVKERNWKDRLQNQETSKYWRNPPPEGRLYIKRQNGGHGLVEQESAYNATIDGLSEYIKWGRNKLYQISARIGYQETYILSAKRS